MTSPVTAIRILAPEPPSVPVPPPGKPAPPVKEPAPDKPDNDEPSPDPGEGGIPVEAAPWAMRQKSLAITGLAASAVFVSALVALMVSLYLSEPRTGPFDRQFSLVDDRGNAVDQSIFRGHPALVYFGYTHCPEACPTTLYEVADWLGTLGDQGRALKAYFFSIDPERDTQEVMHDRRSSLSCARWAGSDQRSQKASISLD